MNYWKDREELKEKAISHTELMAAGYEEDITKSIAGSKIYGGGGIAVKRFASEKTRPSALIRRDTVEALFETPQDKHIAVLNFASYTHPGGKFIEGSSAQEESLCHASFLYNVLKEFPEYYKWNEEHKERGLYLDRAIWTPRVKFFNKDGCVREADVITCAAPNRSVMINYDAFSEVDNLMALRQRTRFLSNIVSTPEDRPDIVILGAWGCGVFKQITASVFNLLEDSFENIDVERIYAVPDLATFTQFQKHKQERDDRVTERNLIRKVASI